MTNPVQKVDRPEVLYFEDYDSSPPTSWMRDDEAQAYMDQQDREIADLKSKLEAAQARIEFLEPLLSQVDWQEYTHEWPAELAKYEETQA